MMMFPMMVTAQYMQAAGRVWSQQMAVWQVMSQAAMSQQKQMMGIGPLVLPKQSQVKSSAKKTAMRPAASSQTKPKAKAQAPAEAKPVEKAAPEGKPSPGLSEGVSA